MKKNQLEIACFGLYSVVLAQENGADRIELCLDMSVGGISPSSMLVAAAREITTSELYVMIRPRGGSFVYNEAELNEMKKAVLDFKNLNADGFVFGILNEDGTVNEKQNAELVQLANPLPCTFHRAFDDVPDPHQALEQLIKIGFSSILTSGGAVNAIAGIDVLENLIRIANTRIKIIPGGGIRSTNINLLLERLGPNIYHSSAVLDETDVPSIEEIIKLKKVLS
ncbi:copper homeostasis protein CutC [Flavobacterium sp. TMP13]|uniref:copper homeostasis protein CutC n=1 Tax=Flavobacterium sp. TMP13 TaxID=3425950 RepID=UPI003D788FD7